MNRERRIIVIQPNRKDSKSTASRTKLRVAAYCRVSTEEEEQQGSFEIQKEFYTAKINSTPEWQLAGIYADDGISGVHTKKRDGFNQMIQDCKKHKIDLILTKSISRFARNTVDSIQYVRMLKLFGVTVIFEKENINTSTMNSEMLLTVLSAFAQAESESISQNISRGKRMGFRHGRFSFPYASFLDEKLKHASEEIDNLQKQVDQLTASQQKAANPNLQLTDSDFRITEYSDTLVARIIERIEVISAVRIKIEFIGGYTVTVPLQS